MINWTGFETLNNVKRSVYTDDSGLRVFTAIYLNDHDKISLELQFSFTNDPETVVVKLRKENYKTESLADIDCLSILLAGSCSNMFEKCEQRGLKSVDI